MGCITQQCSLCDFSVYQVVFKHKSHECWIEQFLIMDCVSCSFQKGAGHHLPTPIKASGCSIMECALYSPILYLILFYLHESRVSKCSFIVEVKSLSLSSCPFNASTPGAALCHTYRVKGLNISEKKIIKLQRDW